MPNFDIAALNKQVIADAWEQYEKIVDHLNAKKNQQLAKVRAQLEQSSGREVAEETTRARSMTQKQLGEAAYANKRALIAERTRMEQEIFTELRRRLDAFCAGPEYADFLQKRFSRACAPLKDCDVVVTVCARDEKLIAELCAKTDGRFRVETDREITVGGFRLYCEARGVVYDDTLDTELERRREWFKQTSQLTIV